MSALRLCLVVFLLLVTSTPSQAELLLGVEWDASDSKVYRIDSDTGETSFLGNSGFPALNSLTRVGNRFLSVSQIGIGPLPRLVEINPQTGVGTLVGTINGFPHYVSALAWSESTGLLGKTDLGVYRIDMEAIGGFVSATQLSSQSASIFAMEFDAAGTLYVGLVAGGTAGSVNSLAIGTMNTTTFAIDTISTVLAVGPQSLEFLPDGSLLAYGNTFNNASTHNLYNVDLNNSAFTSIGNPNAADIRGLAVIPEPSAALLVLLGVVVLSVLRWQG
ncbi:MAG: hypothetical protein HZA89_11830 [Verrucomicrobia bacterium]|nr:hypothetical protein [Verrucomicrobiota bacterium]